VNDFPLPERSRIKKTGRNFKGKRKKNKKQNPVGFQGHGYTTW
jgi:hypothetical protein